MYSVMTLSVKTDKPGKMGLVQSRFCRISKLLNLEKFAYS